MPIGFSKPVRGRRPLPVGSGSLSTRLWVPTDAAATLLGWWDVGDSSTVTAPLTNGANRVTSLTSKGGISRTATTLDASLAPVYDGTNKWMTFGGNAAGALEFSDTDFPLGDAPGLMACVARGDKAAAGFAFSYGGTTTSGFRVIGSPPNATGGARNGSADNTTPTDFLNNSWALILDAEKGGGGVLRINGGATTVTSASRSVATTSTGRGNFGLLSRNTNYLPLTGKVMLAVAYAGTLSQADTERLEGYMAWTTGQQGLLPAPHPFKSAAPTMVA